MMRLHPPGTPKPLRVRLPPSEGRPAGMRPAGLLLRLSLVPGGAGW